MGRKRKNIFEQELRSKLTDDSLANIDFLIDILKLEEEKEDFLEPSEKKRYHYKNAYEKSIHKVYVIAKFLYEEYSKANEQGLVHKADVLDFREFYHKLRGIVINYNENLPL